MRGPSKRVSRLEVGDRLVLSLAAEPLRAGLLIDVGLVDGDARRDEHVGGPAQAVAHVEHVVDLAAGVFRDEEPGVTDRVEDVAEVVNCIHDVVLRIVPVLDDNDVIVL